VRITEAEGAVTFDVRVQARASRARVLGVQGERLKVALTAPPVDGQANEALIRLLATLLEVPLRNVEILRGHAGREKTVRVLGVGRRDVEELARR
jgi:uncharacterized protein